MVAPLEAPAVNATESWVFPGVIEAIVGALARWAIRTPVKVGGVSDVFERAFVARSVIEPLLRSRLDAIAIPFVSNSSREVEGE